MCLRKGYRSLFPQLSPPKAYFPYQYSTGTNFRVAGRGAGPTEKTEILGRLRLVQRDGCFKLGSETLALGRFATVRKGWKVCDLACGSGAAGLLLLEREAQLSLTGVERDPAAAALAEENYTLNGVTGRVLTGDLRDPDLLSAGGFDLVLANPPWFPVGAGKSGGAARSEESCTLEELCRTAARILKNGGRCALVHHPSRLPELLSDLHRCGIEPKRMQLIQHTLQSRPSAVLVEGVRQGRPGLETLPVLLQVPPESPVQE